MAKGKDNALALYARDSSRPLAALLFVIPMMIAYEGATWAFGAHTSRNGADIWLRESLQRLGFGQHLVLPILTFGILLGWHHVKGFPWKIRLSVPPGMAIESLCFAVALVFVARFQSRLFDLTIDAPVLNTRKIGQMFTYLGAGIYEELLFRLMLLPLVIATAKGFHCSPRASLILGVVVSSLLFSAAHYQVFTGYGDEWQLFSFSFRFIAGVFFSMLFLKRGFGIAVGSHALYDMLVVVL